MDKLMKRKRLKNRLKRKRICSGRGRKPKGRPSKRQEPPFGSMYSWLADPFFWLNLAAIDFYGFWSMGTRSNDAQIMTRRTST
jgi:hypothetical protein